jgi:hypothetical protein
MNRSADTGPSTNPADALEFEITDFASARAAHEALPPGVGRLPELVPHYWDTRRRKPLPTDRALSGTAIDWLLALPPSLRPRALCEAFPRVANALAESWPDAPVRAALIDSLLTDRRGGRADFPADIRREIEALRKA